MSFADELAAVGGWAEGRPPPPHRLQAYSRYVALVAEQLDALKHGDAPRLRELAEARRAIEAELAADDDAELPTLLSAGIRELQEHTEADREVRDRVADLQTGALQTVRGMRLRPVRRGRYAELSAADAKVDVRL